MSNALELESPIPTANESDDGPRLFLFSFGAYGWTKLDVFAYHVEDALEHAVEWLDDNAPGHLVQLTDSDWAEAAKEAGFAVDTEDEDEQNAIREIAEADLTMVGGHTTLTHGEYLRSWEWTVAEVTR